MIVARRRPPVLTLALTTVALGLLLAPDWSAALEFRRERVLAGELWRVWSGHLVHATPRLAVLDLAVLALLGAWWERRSRRALAWILASSALAASLALLAFGTFERYTGSSALDAGLFVAAALALALGTRGAARLACALLVLAFAAKCALEAAGYGALFASLPAGASVAAEAHAAGGLAGALVVVAREQRARRALRQPPSSRGPSHR